MSTTFSVKLPEKPGGFFICQASADFSSVVVPTGEQPRLLVSINRDQIQATKTQVIDNIEYCCGIMFFPPGGWINQICKHDC